MVAFIGPTTFADIFYLVYAVPNMLRRLLGEGALTSALIPVFKSVETEDGAEEARKFASRVITLQVVATSAFTLLVIAGCVALWLFSEENSLGRVYAEYTAAIVPYAIFICAAALFGALLNTRGVYFVPPLMQTLINLVWIAASVVAGLVVGARYGLLGLSLSIVAACAVGAWLLWRLLAMKGVRVSLTLSEKLKTARMKGFLRMFGITLIGVASYPVNLLADRFMAQFIVNEEGAVTCLYQGDRLMQVPFGVLAVSIGTVALAELSKVAADKRRFFAGFTRAMRLSLFLAVPMAAVMALLSTQIVDLTLNYGEFANLERIRALDRTSLALLCYSLGLPGYFAVTCLTRSYFARQEMLTPVKVSWWMVALNIGLNILLLWLTDRRGGARPFLGCRRSAERNAALHHHGLQMALD
ncbi:MAG: lipid II flippase MurJ [Planctomycetota bacterium]|nr:lipid II flippase MurJ [Planctomycetota bacterium]